MSTGLVGSRDTKVGDVLKYELDPHTGYCRVDAVVTVPVGGLSVGAVLENVSVGGKFTLVALATTANANGVLIDSAINDSDTYDVGGDFTLAVLVRGPSQVADKSLTYNADVASAPQKAAVNVALTANASIEVLTQV